MRLLAIDPSPIGAHPSPGPDLPTLLAWLGEAGHKAQALRAPALRAPALRAPAVRAPAIDPGFAAHLDGLLATEAPDLVVAHGPSPAGLAALARARAHDIATVLILWTEAPAHAFAHADRVLVPTDHLRHWLRAAHGVVADTLPIPLSPTQPGPPDPEGQAFLTFVGPAPRQGASVFARIAATLAAVRPDIPLLLAHSPGATPDDAAALTARLAPETQAQIAACPPIPDAELFAITRLLLLPAIDDAAAPRLAAAAAWHGVPVIASDRGPLPELVGKAGTILRLPEIVQADPTLLPGEAETAPWIAAILRLWDGEAAYAEAAAAGRTIAGARHAAGRLAPLYRRFFEESH